MATNTNGITTFWDFISWYLDNVNPDQPGNEDRIAVMLAMMFTILGKEIPRKGLLETKPLVCKNLKNFFKDEILRLKLLSLSKFPR